ncbi:hypothetical protein DAEQUDRAFT_725291 [Daedalea quercina L-15889]|uniref:Uncharacterized protein n=1 Tax=Daedalea quercina L-15889 TaxID=1314783 RepID=A0A165R783_9APHY|nr:hypothetical protein DAEQUDRAFT_725291 [Daedalea quercina L-15889]
MIATHVDNYSYVRINRLWACLSSTKHSGLPLYDATIVPVVSMKTQSAFACILLQVVIVIAMPALHPPSVL